MKRIAIALAVTLAFLLPTAAAGADVPHVHSYSAHHNIDWD